LIVTIDLCPADGDICNVRSWDSPAVTVAAAAVVRFWQVYAMSYARWIDLVASLSWWQCPGYTQPSNQALCLVWPLRLSHLRNNKQNSLLLLHGGGGDWKFDNGKRGTVKNAGVQNARLENAAPVCSGWKMRDRMLFNAENNKTVTHVGLSKEHL